MSKTLRLEAALRPIMVHFAFFDHTKKMAKHFEHRKPQKIPLTKHEHFGPLGPPANVLLRRSKIAWRVSYWQKHTVFAMIGAKSTSEANTGIGGCFLPSFAIFQVGHNAIT